MLYRLFLYSTDYASVESPMIHRINNALIANTEEKWRRDGIAKDIKNFDTEHVIACIEKALTDPETGRCKCHPVVKYIPKQYKRKAFLYIATSYTMAAQVIPHLYAIAMENDLVLYDAQTNRSFRGDCVDHRHIAFCTRRQIVHNAIIKAMQPIWSIRKLEERLTKHEPCASYVVTLRKTPQFTFEERNAKFYACLHEIPGEGETLICEDQCYCICGEGYTLKYVLEGYKKHPNQIGYAGGDSPWVSLLNRMGAEEALRWTKECTADEKKDIYARMHLYEMQKKYPNPAQRLVESVKIAKWQRKQVLRMRYTSDGPYGHEIKFHAIPNPYILQDESVSALNIEEEAASFLLPIVEDIYPDIYARYYLTVNHMPSQMWMRIIERVKEIRKLLLHDPFSEALKPYIEHFDFAVFLDQDDPNYWENRLRTDKMQLCYENRYKICELYDVFIRWSEAQIECYGSIQDLMLNIQGP